jgi:hypothetical protein
MGQVDGSSSAPAEHHAVRFYENDKSLARIVAGFLHEGFDSGSPGIVVATANQRAEILRELNDRSCDVVALERSQDLVLLDAEETLSTFMTDGKPNARKLPHCFGRRKGDARHASSIPRQSARVGRS